MMLLGQSRKQFLEQVVECQLTGWRTACPNYIAWFSATTHAVIKRALIACTVEKASWFSLVCDMDRLAHAPSACGSISAHASLVNGSHDVTFQPGPPEAG